MMCFAETERLVRDNRMTHTRTETRDRRSAYRKRTVRAAGTLACETSFFQVLVGEAHVRPAQDTRVTR